MPCCAKYSYDENWYRCEVTDLTENGAVVLYVDYGNSETVPTDNLRKLEPQFIDFPIQVHICELYGAKPTGDNLSPETKNMLLKIPNQELFAKVMVPGKICQVELLVKTDDGDYKPALEVLAEKKLTVIEQ
ncbi:hypothetical protein AVEN_54996-2 [Araneus ventricosus]|uniref:Tudor domain-containing protein n=1 Tax=Araneus ventricosus TaxID=182803 RepID=A0A4Y2K006_ARAVE|nr:hypothetical protein AVEN_54996-2 [Araneus ventricosus]